MYSSGNYFRSMMGSLAVAASAMIATPCQVIPTKILRDDVAPLETNSHSDTQENHIAMAWDENGSVKSVIANKLPINQVKSIKVAELKISKASKNSPPYVGRQNEISTTPQINKVNKVQSPRKGNRQFKAISHGIYNTLELEFSDTNRITAWAAVMPSLAQDQNSVRGCLSSESHCGSDVLSSWANDLRHLRSMPWNEIILKTNIQVNAVPYRPDNGPHGTVDNWASPREFLTRGGDCEDYALLKMASLSALGIPQQDMRIVVGVLEDGRAHAVLNVNYHGVDMILDNRQNSVASSVSSHFTPKYSVNFEKRWTHIERKSTTLYAENIAR